MEPIKQSASATKQKKAPPVENFIQGGDLKAMRLDAGITTSVMAEFMGVKSRKTIENWESEISCPSINQFLLFCRFCDCHSGKITATAMARNASGKKDKAINVKGCYL